MRIRLVYRMHWSLSSPIPPRICAARNTV
jgi:hypothetical protein